MLRPRTGSFLVIALLALAIATASGAGVTQRNTFTIALSETQTEDESGATRVNVAIHTSPAQAGANYVATLTGPHGTHTSLHGQLDGSGEDTAVFVIEHAGSYTVQVQVLAGGSTVTGTLHFHGRVLGFPIYFVVNGPEPGALLHSSSGFRATHKKITPYHGNLGGFSDPSAYADAHGTVDPPERGCRTQSYHGKLFGKHDPHPAHCGWGKTMLASDSAFPMFFLGTAITRQLWAKEYLAKGAPDLRDQTIAVPRVRLVQDQIDTAGKTQRLPQAEVSLLGGRLAAADVRNIQAFDAINAFSRSRKQADRKTAEVALAKAIEHEQFVVEHLAKFHLLHRDDVPEFQLSIAGGYLPTSTRTSLCVVVSTTGQQPGARVLVDTLLTDGTTVSQVVTLDAHGRGKMVVNAPPANNYATEVTAKAFGSDAVVEDFDRYADAPAGC